MIIVDPKLHKKAKEMGVGISAFLEIKLREYLAFIESGNKYAGAGNPAPIC